MVLMFFKNRKKNQSGLQSIGEILVNTNLADRAKFDETLEMVCLMKKFGQGKYNGLEKARVRFLSKSEFENNESLKKKVNKGGILTISLNSSSPVGGRDFNSKDEVVEYFEVKSSPIGKVFLYDSQRHGHQNKHFFGYTFADVKSELNSKNKLVRNPHEVLKDFFAEFKKRLEEIERVSVNFHGEIKVVNDGLPSMLTLVCLKSEDQNSIVRLVAHVEKKSDITYHRRHQKGGNFLSFSAKAKWLLPILQKELAEHWSITDNILHTPHGGRTEKSFKQVFEIIQRVAIKIEPKKEKELKTHAEAHVM